MKKLGQVKCVHMVGIKGTGMSSLAVNLKHMGLKVSGSDFPESFFTDELLRKQNLHPLTPFSPQNIPSQTNLVIVSTAYNNKNAEVREAERRGLKIISYAQMLGILSQELKSVAICGSHGKTTTSATLGVILSKSRYRPIVNVGSIVPQLINYRAHRPRLLVFEADEYQNKFEFFHPRIVILTNIDFDHPDYFHNPKRYKSVFRKFVKRIPKNGLLIFCADDKNCRDVAKNAVCARISYGFSKHAAVKINIAQILPNKMVFSLNWPGRKTRRFTSQLIGEHNALNLGAASICADYLGIPAKRIENTVAGFMGTKRRMEIVKKVKINGCPCIVIDDFAHHPTEIRSTIKALKTAYPEKALWTVFQPHTFSRTEALFDDFARAFDKSDKTIILDIYASKREASGRIHSRDLVNRIGSVNIFYKPDIAGAADFIKKEFKSEGIVLTMGASNIWELARLL